MTSQQQKQAEASSQVTGEAVSWKILGLPPKFARLVLHRQEIKHQIDQLEEKSKSLTDEITLAMAQQDIKVVFVDAYRATIVESTRSSLSKEKLLELGVPAETIVAATTESHYSFLKVDDTEKGKTARREKKAKVTPIRKGKKGRKS